MRSMRHEEEREDTEREKEDNDVGLASPSRFWPPSWFAGLQWKVQRLSTLPPSLVPLAPALLISHLSSVLHLLLLLALLAFSRGKTSQPVIMAQHVA